MKARSHFRPIALALTAAIVAVAAFTTSASGAGGPVNQTPPTISGTAKAGETLTATNGTWTPAPTSYTYAWQRCSDTGTACANIDGATASDLRPDLRRRRPAPPRRRHRRRRRRHDRPRPRRSPP